MLDKQREENGCNLIGLSIALHLIFLVYNFHLKREVDLQNCWTVFQKVNLYFDVFG